LPPYQPSRPLTNEVAFVRKKLIALSLLMTKSSVNGGLIDPCHSALFRHSCAGSDVLRIPILPSQKKIDSTGRAIVGQRRVP
jgi:hypothetical protein